MKSRRFRRYSGVHGHSQRLNFGSKVWSERWYLLCFLMLFSLGGSRSLPPAAAAMQNDPPKETLSPAQWREYISCVTGAAPLALYSNATPPEVDLASQVRLDTDLDWFRQIQEGTTLLVDQKGGIEYPAFSYVLAKTRRFPLEVFARYSRRDVPWYRLFKPLPPRGTLSNDTLRELIHIEGRLERVKKIPPTQILRAEQIQEIYEGWLYPPGNFFDPIYILFTENPNRFDENTKDVWVAFDAYFFKRMSFAPDSEATKHRTIWRMAPLLMARTYTVLPEAPKDLRTDEEKVQLVANLPLVDFSMIEDNDTLKHEIENPDEHNACNYILAFVSRLPKDLMQRQAKRNINVADHLIRPERVDYQNQLIHLEGRLARIKKHMPTATLRYYVPEAGWYETWVFPKNGPDPVCVIFTALPDPTLLELDLSRQHKWIGFDAYSFKLMRYEGAQVNTTGATKQGTHWRVAPLLLGASFEVLPPPQEKETLTFSNTFVPVVTFMIVLVGGVSLGLVFWFRRNDRRVQAQVAEQRHRINPFE